MPHDSLLRRPRRPQAFTALSYLAAPVASIGRETYAVVSNPKAFFGGIVGAALVCAALVAAFGPRPAQAEAMGPEVDFSPGVLTPLGVVHPEDIKVITVDMQSVETTPPEAVTKDPTPSTEPPDPPKPQPPKPAPPKPTPPKPVTDPGPANTDANNPYPEPPTVDQNQGDPFGDPQGWGELVKDGDAWATAAMQSLNAMRVPAWAAQVPNGKYGFRLQVCRDGRIAKVFTKSSSGDKSLDNAVRGELMRTKLPPMPARLASQMPGNCATLKYSFVWGGGTVR